MNEVLQKLFFVLIAISIFYSGCVTTPTTNETNQFTEPNKRIDFPNERFSIERPPDDWVMKTLSSAVVAWENYKLGSRITISTIPNPDKKSITLPTWANSIIKYMEEMLEEQLSIECSINTLKEEEVHFANNEFFKIVFTAICTNEPEIQYYASHYLLFVDDHIIAFALAGDSENNYRKAGPIIENLLQSLSLLSDSTSSQHRKISLIDAVTSGDHEKVKELLDSGTNVNSRNSIGNTALIYASAIGYAEIVETLIAYGAEVNVKCQNGATALCNACSQGHTRIVKILLDANANVNIRGDKGYSPLLASLIKDDLESAKNLINAGADVNSTTVYGYTPLMSASFHGHYYIAKLLIDRGALVNVREGKAEQSSLLFASDGGHKLLVELLLESGANVNERDKFGWTPLMRAAQHGHPDIVKLLLDNGADVNAKSNYGWNALMIAKRQGHIEVVKLLNAAGAIEEEPTGPFDISIHDYLADYII